MQGEACFDDLERRFPELADTMPAIRRVSSELVALFRRGGTLYLAGNGGSAADSEHICGELLKGFKSLRPLPEPVRAEFAAKCGGPGQEIAAKLQNGLRAVSLLSHPGFLSAFCNDVDASLIFAQQLWALGRPGDVMLGISTGGGAVNIEKAFMTARVMGIRTVLLTGNRHGRCERVADEVIAAPSAETYRIQEYHLPIYHAICLAVENAIFNN